MRRRQRSERAVGGDCRISSSTSCTMRCSACRSRTPSATSHSGNSDQRIARLLRPAAPLWSYKGARRRKASANKAGSPACTSAGPFRCAHVRDGLLQHAPTRPRSPCRLPQNRQAGEVRQQFARRCHRAVCFSTGDGDGPTVVLHQNQQRQLIQAGGVHAPPRIRLRWWRLRPGTPA